MNFLKLFTPKNFNEIFSKENFTDLVNYAKSQIVAYVNKNDLLGSEKKQKVDDAVTFYVDLKFNNSRNAVVKMIVGLLKSAVPCITQLIYDYLKEVVDGLTVKGA